MSIIDRPRQIVQTKPLAARIAEADQFIAKVKAGRVEQTARFRAYVAERSAVLAARAAEARAEPTPADVDTTDHAEPFQPTFEDLGWWTENADHLGWPVDGELSPAEQDAELDRLDRYNDQLEAMFEDHQAAETIASGIAMW